MLIPTGFYLKLCTQCRCIYDNHDCSIDQINHYSYSRLACSSEWVRNNSQYFFEWCNETYGIVNFAAPPPDAYGLTKWLNVTFLTPSHELLFRLKFSDYI